MSIGKILGDAWGLYTRFFTRFILVAIPVFVVLGLVNAIVGAKVAIISDRPQTTRRAVRGIATDLHLDA